ncbi:PqiC family protein [Xylophilus sp. GOD-11R]|uniref:PqiC family protein n=1 Tax=Xylophilus sp. GOD-11R TaxID=3089814 RepID=UPI00298CD7D2|nr:PqiC family protein [Xylophilus sp. GOD-11R]WPB58099.1 PqiC family protein [Xylophilus sp. GOD-11R]
MKPSVLFTRTAAAAVAAAVAALGAGCASQPDRYYTLAAPSSVTAPAAATATPPLFVEIAPVAMPERLARPQMVVRKDTPGAEVRILEQHRWASSFEKEMRDALAAGIASRAGAIDVTKGGRPSSPAVWRVAVQLQGFDAVEDRGVQADFSWTLRRADRDDSLSCSYSTSEPAAAGIDAIAHGAQQVTRRASEAIGAQLLALQASPRAGCIGG